MSTARGVLTVVGQVVGAYFGGPYGAAIGGAVGGYIGGEIDGPQQAQGPRLADAKVPTVAQGAPMTWLEGAQRLALNPVWISARREVATTTNQGGKGASDSTTDVTTYTYVQDVLYYVTGNPIAGIRRLWDNGKLIWTMADDASAGSLAASSSTDKWARLTVYTGAPGQLPDPTYEAAVGLGNAPAYRGRGTVFIGGLELGNGGALPLLSAEVLSEADTTQSVETEMSSSVRIGYTSFFGSSAPSVKSITVPRPQWTTAYLPVRPDFWAYNQVVYNLITGTTVDQGFDADGGIGVERASVVAGGSSDSVMLIIGGDASVGRPTPSYLMYPGATEIVPADSGMVSAEFVRYAKSGSTLVIGSYSSGAKALHRYDTAGNYVSSSAPLGNYVQWLCISGSTLWALSITSGTQALYEMSLAGMTLTATHALPTGSPQLLCIDAAGRPVVYMDTGAYGVAYTWDGLAWTQSYGPHMAKLAAGAVGGFIANGVLVTLSGETISGGHLRLIVRRNDKALPLQTVDLADVVARQCARAGLAAGQIDVTALAGMPVRGMAITQVTPVRTVLQNLAAAFLFDAAESGGKIKFVRRGGAAVRTIAYTDMGASRGGVVEPLPMRRLNPLEKPATATIRFANALDDYQDGAESSDRLVDDGNGVQVLELPIVLSRTEARRLAEVAISDINNARFSFGPVALNNDHADLEPTDVVVLTDAGGNTLRARIGRHTASGGINQIEAVLDDPSVLTQTLVSAGNTSDSNSVTVSAPADTQMLLFDTGLLRDADDALGLYVAAKGEVSPWAGAAILKSTDDITYTRAATVLESAVWGTCETPLPDWAGGNRLDTVSTLDVNVRAGTLSSVTYAQLLDSDANAFLVGAEIIKARVCTLLTAGRYRLSDLLRGRRGTEWASTGHAAEEAVVLLQTTGLRRIVLGTAELSAVRYYKGVTIGRRESTVVAESFTCQGLSQKPWSPVDLRGSRSSGDLTVTWARRTRLATNFSAGAVPLGEEAEAYSIDIYSSSAYTTVLRTLTASTPTVAYPAAQQTTDFGSAQAVVYLRIYQLSATVGRGYALQGGI